MRFYSVVPIGILGVLVVTGCSGSSSSQLPAGLPAAGAAASGAGAARSHAAHRLGGVRRSIALCAGSGFESFVGGMDGNVAAAMDSGVLGGHTNYACDADSSVVGGLDNVINSGGAAGEFIGAGLSNEISGGDYSFIGDGNANAVSGAEGFIGAGQSNTVSAQYGTVSGGLRNTNSGFESVIGGGVSNVVSNTDAVISGGAGNVLSGYLGTISGGENNTLKGQLGVVAGGSNNMVPAQLGTVSGGHANQATGEFGTVPGGELNIAAGYGSLAAGINSDAANTGAFVWSDAASGATQLKSTASDQFLARATGGVKFFSNATLTTGVTLAPGGGSWASVSDRAVKTNIEPIDDAAILDRVAAMPISQWSYISERGVRHVGPMAQDFYAAFGIGEDNKHITSIDEDGVALAAIKALDARLVSTRAQLNDTNARLARKDLALHDLQRQMAAMRAQTRQHDALVEKELTELAARGSSR